MMLSDANILVAHPCENVYRVICDDILALSPAHVLDVLSTLKGRLQLETSPNAVINLECEMTSDVRKNMIIASKKLKMYGKNTPVIACFDEYGNRLPDRMNIGDDSGVIVKVVEPVFDKSLYLSLTATTCHFNIKYPHDSVSWKLGDCTYIDDEPGFFTSI